MKCCFLHVGFHKTATTSFQLTLQHNRKLLEQDGIYLPKFRGKKQKFSANHSGQIRDIFDEKAQNLWDGSNRTNPAKSKTTNRSKPLPALDVQLLDQDHDILISGEGCRPCLNNL